MPSWDALRYTTISFILITIGFVLRLAFQAAKKRDYPELLRNSSFVFFATFAVGEISGRLHGGITWRTPVALVAAVCGAVGIACARH